MTPAEQASATEQVGFRFPPGLMERVKRAAKEDDRTATSWVVRRIKEALEDHEKKRRN